MRIVFMGAGEIAIPSLKWLIETDHGHEIVGVYTQPDKKVGRKQIVTPPAIKVLAEKAGIPVMQPDTFRNNPEAIAELEALRCDLAVVMAYGQILPKAVIEAPALACVNLHASLLPRHRGASPIQASIREGDEETGITLMHIVPKLDAGDMIETVVTPITPEDTGGILHDRLAGLGPELMEKGLPLFVSQNIPAEPQNEELVTYSGKLEREHGLIDWSLDAEFLERLIRAYDPWPGTYTSIPNEKGGSRKLKLFPPCSVVASADGEPGEVLESEKELLISCGKGALRLQGELQIEGRKRLDVSTFLNGIPLEPGTFLGKD